MRDILTIFGSLSLAVKATAVMSTNIIDMGPGIDDIGHSGNTPDLGIVFSPAADFASADGFIPVLYHCKTSAGTYTEVARGVEVSAPAAGKHVVLAMPKSHYRYLKAGAIPSSTGTFTATTVNAWIGVGEHDEALGA